MAAALAYYTIFSLAPLLIITIAIAGLVFGQKAAQGAIVAQVQGLIGTQSGKAIEAMLQSAHKPAPGLIASIIGVITLLLGAAGVFTEIEDALNTIWDTESATKPGIWNLVKSRFMSFGMVLIIGFLLLVSLLLSVALAAMSKYFGAFLTIPPAVLHIFDLLISFVVITILFATIFKVLPRIIIAWNDVWVGAAITSLLFAVGKFVIGFYIGKSISASVYGAAGSLIILVAWIYYSGIILYFGAEFTRVYSKEFGSHAGEEATRQAEQKDEPRAPENRAGVHNPTWPTFKA